MTKSILATESTEFYMDEQDEQDGALKIYKLFLRAPPACEKG